MLNARAAGSIPASVTTNRIFHSVFSTVILAGVAWRHTGIWSRSGTRQVRGQAQGQGLESEPRGDPNGSVMGTTAGTTRSAASTCGQRRLLANARNPSLVTRACPRADWCAEGWAHVDPRGIHRGRSPRSWLDKNLRRSQRGAEAIRLSHSGRSATIGSTRKAGRAGTGPDTVATAVNTTMVIANDARSAAPTPNS